MMRTWRQRDFASGKAPLRERLALRLWAYAAKRPRLYHAIAGRAADFLARRAGSRGSLDRAPLLKAWTGKRDLAAPAGKTFHSLYARAKRKERQ
jgi:L-lactate dehydrogenase complex protein LldF